MIREGLKNVAAGANPVIAAGGLKTIDKLVEEIAAVAKPVEGSAIAQVATSAGNDEEVGTMIAEAMQRVTKDGVITVEESKSLTTDLDVVEGMQTEAIFLPTSSPTTSGWWWNLKTLDPAHRQENQHHPGFDSLLKSRPRRSTVADNC